MQSQLLVMAYRKDLFDKNGLTPPTTFEELRTDAKKLQDAEGMKYPIALPLLSTADLDTAFAAALGSQDSAFFVNPDTKKPNFDQEPTAKALEQLKSLLPYMDPQVTTFDQPKVQQQLYNGKAAVAVMFSGRMNDLVQQKNTKLYDKFAFAAPPAVFEGGKAYSTVSTDGWSIPVQHQGRQGPALPGHRRLREQGGLAGLGAGGLPRPHHGRPERLAVRRGDQGLAGQGPDEGDPALRAGRERGHPSGAGQLHGGQDRRRPTAQQQMQAAAEKVMAARSSRLRVGPSSSGPTPALGGTSRPTCHRTGRGVLP